MATLRRPSPKRRASGLFRALLLGSATLAILFVCFSIYQFAQDDVTGAPKERPSRLSADAVKPIGVEPVPTATGGIQVGSTTLGDGSRVKLTLYSKNSDKPWAQIAFRDWSPVQGATNEFRLSEPEIRLRTSDGHAVLVRADRGVLEAERQSGTGLRPQRGNFRGNVLIQYDRLTDEQRSSLPPDQRDTLDPLDLINVEVDELDFDMEYSKLIVPGKLHLTSRDADLQTEDLEVRFNDVENRVEYLRIGQGGRLELRGGGPGAGLGGLGGSLGADLPTSTVVQWILASLQDKIAAAQASTKTASPTAAPVSMTEAGVPVFSKAAARASEVRPPLVYLAAFHGHVVATQMDQDTISARLSADLLELMRTLADEEEPQSPAAVSLPAASGSDSAESAPAAIERIVVEWSDRLIVEICEPEDARCATATRANVEASGSPVRIKTAQGDATGATLSYDPDGERMSLSGSSSIPALVQFGNLGTIAGSAVSSERQDDVIDLHVDGPGSLRWTGTEATDATTPIAESSANMSGVVRFKGALDAVARVVTRRSRWIVMDFSTQTDRVLERANFTGGVTMQQGDMGLDADTVSIKMASSQSSAHRSQVLDHVHATGSVVLSSGDDRLTCREIDIPLKTDATGQSKPSSATAVGDVVATVGSRSIRASDKLIVDFRDTDHPASQSTSHDDTTTSDSSPPAGDARSAAVRRLRAFGDVVVLDTHASLEIVAHQLDAHVASSDRIETALVEGTEDRDATIRLKDVSIAGQRIRLNGDAEHVEVNGPGSLTFLSSKDLDGHPVDEPIAVVITWSRSLVYDGASNRAEFLGDVHATSQTTTTFDCDRLLVEFEDVVADAAAQPAVQDWLSVKDFFKQMMSPDAHRASSSSAYKFSKEPTYILADGHAVVLTSEFVPGTDRLKSRARIAGPRLAVYLRSDVSKMVIEGAGTLLIEDYSDAPSKPGGSAANAGGLFAAGKNSGPSTTLIEWADEMWYDLTVSQTRFRGDVYLRYFSGSQVNRVHPGAVDSGADTKGRATFLKCRTLTVDFADTGRLSVDELDQFQATGDVVLQDRTEGLSVQAASLVYWKRRDLLEIYGAPGRKAHIVKRKAGRLPSQVSVDHLFYNLATGKMELRSPQIRTR